MFVDISAVAPGFDRGLVFAGDESEEMQPKEAASVLNIEDVMTSADTFDFLQVKPIEREQPREPVTEQVSSHTRSDETLSLRFNCCYSLKKKKRKVRTGNIYDIWLYKINSNKK